MYNKLLGAINEVCQEAVRFNYAKIDRDMFSNEVKQHILTNDFMTIVDEYKRYKNMTTSSTRFSLPMLLNIKKNLKDVPSVKTVKYI